MAESVKLAQALERRGAFAVWHLMNEEERRAATAALWTRADRETHAALDLALARELKFRPQSVRHLPADRVVPRILRIADKLPDAVLFQFLYHLHLEERRPLLVEFLDAVGLPHKEGVLELGEEEVKPEAERLLVAARDLLAKHDHQALVYLATLRVADKEYWAGLETVLAGYDEDGAALPAASA